MNPRLNLKVSTVTPLDLDAPSPEMKESVEAVERIVDYKFKKNKRLLEEALTHPSCTNVFSYKRLAFMGDAVLGLAVTRYLYHEYPEIAQGYLTLLRKANVSTEKFARVAVRHKLYTYLRCTAPDVDDQIRKFIEVVNREDQEKTLVYQGSMKAPKVLADIVASVAAAIYVDLNFNLEEFWMKFRHVLEPIVTLEDVQEEPITKLLDVCQKQGKLLDISFLREETKSIASVYVDGKFVASCSSENRVIAKVNAAEIALCKLTKLMCINDPSVEVIAGMDGSFPIEGAKQELHQLCVKKKWPEPIYMIEHESGPPHEMKFVSTVQIATIDSVLCMTGDEKSRRRQAENSAASLMILALHDSDYKFRHVLEPLVTLEELQQQPQPMIKLFEVCQKHGKHVDVKYWRDETKSIGSVYVDGKLIASGSSD